MIMTARTLFVRASLALALLVVPVLCLAATPTRKSTSTTSQNAASSDESASGPLDLFEAIDDGLVEVKFIPKNEKQARVRIKNLSDRPLSVRLPEAFGARAVLAQPGPVGAANGQSGGAQNLGGNFAGQNNQNRQGIFNVPADKPAELRTTCVCLEYGKPTPRPAIPYEMVRLDTVTKEPSMADLLSKLETSNQREVQAATWHLASGMSWQQLAAIHVEHLVEANEPFFTAHDLKEAKELLQEMADAAKVTQALTDGTAGRYATAFSAAERRGHDQP